MRAYTKFEIVLGFAILLFLVAYSASLTKQSFTKSKEVLNKDNINTIDQSLKLMVKNNDDLSEVFPECMIRFCDIDKDLVQSRFLNSQIDPPAPLMAFVPKTNDGKPFRLKVHSEGSYVIEGQSAKNSELCWIVDTEGVLGNIKKDQPTQCLTD